MDRIAIIGLGLMGGSLGLALKARGFGGVVAGYTRSAPRRTLALERGAVDEVFDTAAQAVRGAALVVYGAPILAIPALVRETAGALAEGAVLTDVGSTKQYLMDVLPPLLADRQVQFVGSHPIAGSEQQGIEVARADLYEGAVVVVTPPAGESAALESVLALWRGVGARTVVLDAETHDRILARTSHLPHLVASLLSTTVGRSDTSSFSTFCGSGFRDTTRVAEGAAEIWRDILASNREQVLNELRAYGSELNELVRHLENNDLDAVQQFLERGRLLRRALIDSTT